jgi:hypothetical protein
MEQSYDRELQRQRCKYVHMYSTPTLALWL